VYVPDPGREHSLHDVNTFRRTCGAAHVGDGSKQFLISFKHP
jgi:hypothetical protein